MESITVEAKNENLEKITDMIDTILDKIDCPVKVKLQINVAVDEIFSNISSYAYKQNVGNATVEIETFDNPKSVEITFKDNGVEYNPLLKGEPNVKANLEERDVGGLGVFIVKKSMDDVKYEYSNGMNIFTMRKKYE